MSGYLAINGAVVKPPKDFKISYEDIDADSSGRNAAGQMIRDVIARKVKLELAWGPLSDSEISEILIKSSSAFFSVTYTDAFEGKMLTRIFYAGAKTSAAYSWNEKFKANKWEGLSINFIEQ